LTNTPSKRVSIVQQREVLKEKSMLLKAEKSRNEPFDEVESRIKHNQDLEESINDHFQDSKTLSLKRKIEPEVTKTIFFLFHTNIFYSLQKVNRPQIKVDDDYNSTSNSDSSSTRKRERNKTRLKRKRNSRSDKSLESISGAKDLKSESDKSGKQDKMPRVQPKDGHRHDNVKYRKVIATDGRGDMDNSDEEERISRVRAKEERRRDNIKYRKLIATDDSGDMDSSDEEERISGVRAKEERRRDNVKYRKVIAADGRGKVIAADGRGDMDSSDKVERISRVRAKEERRRDNVKYRKVIVTDGRGDMDSSDEEERISRVRAKEERRRDIAHGKFQKYCNEDSGSRSRNALVANLIATKSVLLERERASEEVMQRAIEVALLNERNAQLKSRLRLESKAHFDRHLINNNLNDLYDIF